MDDEQKQLLSNIDNNKEWRQLFLRLLFEIKNDVKLQNGRVRLVENKLTGIFYVVGFVVFLFGVAKAFL